MPDPRSSSLDAAVEDECLLALWTQFHDLTRPEGDKDGELAHRLAVLAHRFYADRPREPPPGLREKEEAEDALKAHAIIGELEESNFALTGANFALTSELVRIREAARRGLEAAKPGLYHETSAYKKVGRALRELDDDPALAALREEQGR